MTKKRRATARLHAIQALYQMEITRKGLHDVVQEFETHWQEPQIQEVEIPPEVDVAFFKNILKGVLTHQKTIDRMIERTLQNGWPLHRIEVVLRAILRAGTFELLHRPDVPVRVVIKEYIDLAAIFLEQEEIGMTNGVLDTIAHDVRSREFEP